ncbi:MAG TPA: E3 binding domain-containing protein [Rubrobacter sp.]|nr:E3 binding domain-containing protein [Rubrobacter sp.]
MAKKADKALKSLKKDVAKLKKQNDKLAETLEKAREDQASAHIELRKLLEEHLTTHDVGPDESVPEADESTAVDSSRDGEGEEEPEATEEQPEATEEEPEVTEAAKRRAKEFGVDLSSVKGTGSGGRILVNDVEAAAEAKQ